MSEGHETPSPPATQIGTPELRPTQFSPITHVRRRVRAVLMRAGTSKGLFFHLNDLPASRDEWPEVILGAMGSPDSYSKQLDGLGGGVSTQSKVAILSKSTVPDVDIDYLFCQVPVGTGSLDFSGNCGNILSGVGPFAVDEGLFPVTAGGIQEVTVRIRNVNTDRIIHSTFTVVDGQPIESGTMKLDGVSAFGSPIRLDFLDPSGSMTGKLLPTGYATEKIAISSGAEYTVSCVDAANPFVFVSASDLGLTQTETVAELAERHTSTLMEIRALMAVKMGLATTYAAACTTMGTPKIAIVGIAPDWEASRIVTDKVQPKIDVWIRAFSMGKPHPAIQMTGAICVAAASAIPGSLVHQAVIARRLADPHPDQRSSIVIGHASGTIEVAGKSHIDVVTRDLVVESGSVYRTARRLMSGDVYYMAQRQGKEQIPAETL